VTAQPLGENQTIAASEEITAPEVRAGAGLLQRVPDIVGDGEAFIVEFEAPGAQRVDLLWRGRTLTLTAPAPDSGVFKALLSVPLDEKAASLPLTVTAHFAGDRRERFSADLAVNKRTYPVQKLTVEPRFVTPPKKMEERIKRDRAEMRAAISTVSAHRYWSLPMKRPVPGVVTSQYGLRRVFNDQPRNPHRGLDLRGGEGDPIHAADDGMVVLVSDHYFGGKTVVIDHGLSVLTAYLHLSGFNAHEGQRVRRGDVIGFVGSTGRVTAPHLHLSLYVMGESINPLPLLAKE
jgi:murein DD-endopeptidase MepM/ murein hydrolase activator NlpD